MTRTPFGQRMYEARMTAGLSQAEVCRSVGISQSTLSDAERIAAGSVHTAAFARLYGVSPIWLSDGEGHMKAVSAAAEAQVAWPFDRISREDWSALNERDRGAVEDAAVQKMRELKSERPGGPSRKTDDGGVRTAKVYYLTDRTR